MSAMANTTPIVTTVTKLATNLRDAYATPRVNIQDLCEEYYEDILPIIIDKVRCDKKKEVQSRDRSRHMKRRKDSESLLSNVSKSDSSDGRYWKSNSKRHKPMDEDDLMMPWMCEELKKYVKDPVEIHNIKQKNEETIEDFIERFKVETGRIKGAPKCMRISKFMHGVNNPKLTKRLNEHVPKTMEEMMITTTAFIQGEATVTSKKKGHTSWRTHDQSKRQTSKKRSLSQYNGIIGRPGIKEIQAVPSTAHEMLKFPVDGE
nr:reverse transcriptase domain-containing protein [Tanacetum cinerariifolium]